MGTINDHQIFQAKGHDFTLQDLLGKDEWAALFQHGCYATLYLSPADYHRVHTPLAGNLKAMRLFPGELYSVNPVTVDNCPNLFARNERLVTLFDTAQGPMAIILVGALNVGSMFTSWHGRVHSNFLHTWDGHEIHLDRGDEVGGFLMGSTVILLFAENAVKWDEWKPQSTIKLGQKLGRVI
jgi:phosphatidylserine decarboxylase